MRIVKRAIVITTEVVVHVAVGALFWIAVLC